MQITVIYIFIYSIYHIYYVSRLGSMSSSQLFRIPSAGGEQVAYSHRLPLACRMSQSYCRLRLSVESLHIFTIIISIMGFLWLAASAFPSKEWTKTAA